MTDLIERLKHCSANTSDEYLHELTGRAAERIATLEAQLAEARAEPARIVAWMRPLSLFSPDYLADLIEAGAHNADHT